LKIAFVIHQPLVEDLFQNIKLATLERCFPVAVRDQANKARTLAALVHI